MDNHMKPKPKIVMQFLNADADGVHLTLQAKITSGAALRIQEILKREKKAPPKRVAFRPTFNAYLNLPE